MGNEILFINEISLVLRNKRTKKERNDEKGNIGIFISLYVYILPIHLSGFSFQDL